MRIAKRLQVNMYLKAVSGIKSMANIDPIVFPLAWLNEVSYLYVYETVDYLMLLCFICISASKYCLSCYFDIL